MVNNNLEKIRNEIKKCSDGCTISEIAKRTGLSRNTTRVHLERLIGEESVKVRNIGPAKLIKCNIDKEGNRCRARRR